MGFASKPKDSILFCSIIVMSKFVSSMQCTVWYNRNDICIYMKPSFDLCFQFFNFDWLAHFNLLDNLYFFQLMHGRRRMKSFWSHAALRIQIWTWSMGLSRKSLKISQMNCKNSFLSATNGTTFTWLFFNFIYWLFSGMKWGLTWKLVKLLKGNYQHRL